jgi:hypothetical protein
VDIIPGCAAGAGTANGALFVPGPAKYATRLARPRPSRGLRRGQAPWAGSRADTRQPPAAVGPEVRLPPQAITRSRIPARP